MKRCALYVRVSTQEQKNSGLSVDSQIAALEKYCEEQGYTVAGVYNDAGISAICPCWIAFRVSYPFCWIVLFVPANPLSREVFIA